MTWNCDLHGHCWGLIVYKGGGVYVNTCHGCGTERN